MTATSAWKRASSSSRCSLDHRRLIDELAAPNIHHSRTGGQDIKSGGADQASSPRGQRRGEDQPVRPGQHLVQRVGRDQLIDGVIYTAPAAAHADHVQVDRLGEARDLRSDGAEADHNCCLPSEVDRLLTVGGVHSLLAAPGPRRGSRRRAAADR
jgi:hypothetical protein